MKMVIDTANIQKAHVPWFKNNIETYTKKASKIFGEKIKLIAE